MQLSKSSVLTRMKKSSLSKNKSTKIKLKIRNSSNNQKNIPEKSINQRPNIQTNELMDELHSKIEIYKNIFPGIEKLLEKTEQISLLLEWLNSVFYNQVKIYLSKSKNKSNDLSTTMFKSIQKTKEIAQNFFPIVLESFFIKFFEKITYFFKSQENKNKPNIGNNKFKSKSTNKKAHEVNIFKENSLEISNKLSQSKNFKNSLHKSSHVNSGMSNIQENNSLKKNLFNSSSKNQIDTINLSPIKRGEESGLLSYLNEFNFGTMNDTFSNDTNIYKKVNIAQSEPMFLKNHQKNPQISKPIKQTKKKKKNNQEIGMKIKNSDLFKKPPKIKMEFQKILENKFNFRLKNNKSNLKNSYKTKNGLGYGVTPNVYKDSGKMNLYNTKKNITKDESLVINFNIFQPNKQSQIKKNYQINTNYINQEKDTESNLNKTPINNLSDKINNDQKNISNRKKLFKKFSLKNDININTSNQAHHNSFLENLKMIENPILPPNFSSNATPKNKLKHSAYQVSNHFQFSPVKNNLSKNKIFNEFKRKLSKDIQKKQSGLSSKKYKRNSVDAENEKKNKFVNKFFKN